jgi:ribosomal protein S27AE
MDDVMKKRISIGIAVGCIALAVIITVRAVVSNRSDTGNTATRSGPVRLMCANPQCGNVFEMDAKDIGETTGRADSMEPTVYKCPKCSQMSAYIATKCEKCGNVFIPNYQNVNTSDKCPKCGYSKYEEAKKKEKQMK